MYNTGTLDDLVVAITERRPLVLFLGQNAWSENNLVDPVLVAALKRNNRYSAETAVSGFPSLLDDSPFTPEFYEWLADLYERQPIPEWMEPVAALLWNAVFTTSINPSLTKIFRSHARDVETVLSKEDNPVSPRQRSRLHITYLFGRAGERQRNEVPPHSIQELRTRTALHAIPLLSRVYDTVTPLGVLVIDGFACGRDWLSTDALAGILSAFRSGQIYWFGWNDQDDIMENKLIRELADQSGQIVLVRERLSTALRELELTNHIDLTAPIRYISEDSVSIGDNLLNLSAATRLKTSTAASILDDTWLGPLVPLGPESEYFEFRRFHGYAEDARRLIEGIRRGFAIRRRFEDLLRERVLKALNNAGSNQEAVLIHGQSGSGKSIGLTRLAYEIRATKKFPVLFSPRATRVPGIDEIDEFCIEAEAAGALATLFVCDANAPISRYREIVRALFSRGRRVVVVGSAYRVIDTPEVDGNKASKYLIEVPSELDETELQLLTEILKRFTGIAPQITESEYLLPAIYHILPEVRPLLATGLSREARVAEECLRNRGRVKSTTPMQVGQLGQALINAGLLNPKTLLEEKIEEFLGSKSDASIRAIDYVMVPGKLGCPVPVNILMRAVGSSENLIDVANLFLGIDLFRWSANDEDDIFIHPRLRLEAELISARRLGTAQAEAEVAIQLLNYANPGYYGSSERRFVLDIVHRLGPDGPYKIRYHQSYLTIARALTEMRTKRGVEDPSLMLQEATLRRRYLRDASNDSDIDPATILEEAKEVVDLALDKFNGSTSPGLKRMCANLRVERAAIYGFRAVQLLKQGAKLNEVWQFYLAAKESAQSAIFAADTYHAIDISIWVPNDLLKGADWDQKTRAELIADIWDALERVNSESLDIDQREQFESRRVRVAQTLDNKQLEQNALKALQESGSRAGLFLHARNIGGPLFGSGTPNEEEVERAKQAAAFLLEHEEYISDDARCLRYLLKCQWLIWTLSYLFCKERAPIPNDEKNLHIVLKSVERLRAVEGSLGDPRIRYLEAVLQWRLRNERTARDLWQGLSRETDYSDSRRVVRQHVWTDHKGAPELFNGRIISEAPESGRFRVLVEGIHQEVILQARDFPMIELKRGAGIHGGFNIAFNYIGPIADCPSRRVGRR